VEGDPHPLLPLLKSASTKRMLGALAVIAALIAIIWAIRDVATPVLAALGIAYIFVPIVDALERRGVPRALAVIALMIGVVAALVGVIAVVVPALVAQSSALAARLPAYIARAITWIHDTFHVAIPTDASEVLDRAKAALASLGPDALSKAGAYAASFLLGWVGAIGAVITLVLVPVFVFFFLRDWRSLTDKAMSLLPAPMQTPILAKLRQIDQSLSAYMRGVFTVAMILALIYSISLSLLGVPLGLLIGVLAGLAYAVPFLSGALGIGLGVLFSLLEFTGWGQVLGVVVIFAVGNFIEGLFLTPRIVGDSLGLHPLAVILAVMIGGSLFGFLGVLLALPTAAVINVVGRDLIALWRSSATYRTGLRSGPSSPASSPNMPATPGGLP
jgi:predicted PurR-regulated permease PerM